MDLSKRLFKVNKKISKSFNQIKKVFSKRRNQRKTIYIAGAVIICLLALSLIVNYVASSHRQSMYQQKLSQRQTRIKSLVFKLKEIQQEKATSDAQVQSKAQHEADLQKQIDDLNKQLQAKRDAQSLATRVLNTVTQTKVAYAAPAASYGGCGDNSYAQFIYQHESSCNLNAMNASGCRGIGQACPGSKLPCGADYACQNAYFTNYANKYGGWAGAYQFWLGHGWW